MKVFLVLTAALALAQGQITIQGKCKEENVVPDFNVEKYSGLWYEIYRYEQYFEKDAECVTAQYTLEDGVVKVLNSRVTGGTSWRLAGSASSAPDAEGKGKLNVMFPSIGNIVGKYWVLATDYTGYSLVYSCRDVGDGNINVSSWILSRKPKLTPQQILAINPSVESATGLAWDNYRETSHSEADCKITSTVQ